jgi:hypothetical protein
MRGPPRRTAAARQSPHRRRPGAPGRAGWQRRGGGGLWWAGTGARRTAGGEVTPAQSRGSGGRADCCWPAAPFHGGSGKGPHAHACTPCATPHAAAARGDPSGGGSLARRCTPLTQSRWPPGAVARPRPSRAAAARAPLLPPPWRGARAVVLRLARPALALPRLNIWKAAAVAAGPKGRVPLDPGAAPLLMHTRCPPLPACCPGRHGSRRCHS